MNLVWLSLPIFKFKNTYISMGSVPTTSAD